MCTRYILVSSSISAPFMSTHPNLIYLCVYRQRSISMDLCSKNPNRTAPVGEDGPCQADVPLCSRTNGWSWPPHPFQMLAWLLYTYFAVIGFGVFVPLLPSHWIPAGYIVSFTDNPKRAS